MPPRHRRESARVFESVGCDGDASTDLIEPEPTHRGMRKLFQGAGVPSDPMNSEPSRAGVALSVVLALLTIAASFPASAATEGRSPIEMADFRFVSDFVQVDFGDNVTIFVNNTDPLQHTFELEEFGLSSGTLAAGAKWNATFTANRNGTFYFYCAIPGHATALTGGRGQGMGGRLPGGPTPTDGGQDVTPLVVGG